MPRLRKAMSMAIGLVLVLTGAAVASSYETGTYAAGNPAVGAGVQMKIRSGSFSVQVIRYRETCTIGSRMFSDYFTFHSGSVASLTGKIDQDGRLSGRYVDGAGTVSVSGRVEGGEGTIKSAEHGPYDPATTEHPNFCHGSHRFHVALKAH